MSLPNGPDAWLTRIPRPGETCVFSHGGFSPWSYGDPLPRWKRDALLFDRVYVPCRDPNKPPDLPLELTFGIARVDDDLTLYVNSLSWALAQASAPGSDPEELFGAESLDFDLQLSRRYVDAGIMAEWTYASTRPYLRRFTEGERIAYEGALNNIPLVTASEVSWEQIISFRKDQEAVRKYRDLRLWLRSGLGAESVLHASDIIGQKIENYRWAIRKHGLQTSIGTFKQVFDWKASPLTLAAAGGAGLVGGPIWGTIVGGLAIAAQVGAWIAERNLKSEEVRRGPDREVAILYDIQEKLGK